MNRWLNLAVPTGVGLAASQFVSVGFWDASKQGLLVGLSVIAAGVLVRLARGLPFTTADHYELDEIRKLTRAIGQIVRSLRILIIAVMVGMLGLVIAKPMLDFAHTFPSLSAYTVWVEAGTSGILAFVLSYVLWRMLQVVKGDQDLTELQSQFIVRAVERRQAKRFDDQRQASSTSPYKAPEGYGRLIQ